ncbi:hypothetical protein Gotur_030198 [Gossypium turneri]
MNLLGILMEAFTSLSVNTIKAGLIWLLRVAWIAGTLPILIASLPFPILKSFHTLLLSFAKRGKIMPSSTHRFTVPQSFFLHFYLLAAVWTTSLLTCTWYFAYKVAPLGTESLSYPFAASHLTGGSHVFSIHKSRFTSAEDRFNVWKSVFLLLLMEVHVLRRLYETFNVFNYSSSARMHIFGYLTGIYFYTAAPLSLCTFCVLEAFNFAADQVAEFKVEGQELGSLRERGDRTADYVIPHGDWFEIVSSPHYLAEMIIYAGLLVASGGTDFTIWLLLGFVVANLAFAAAETHQWYLRKFEDYPHNRWAILPFVY